MALKNTEGTLENRWGMGKTVLRKSLLSLKIGSRAIVKNHNYQTETKLLQKIWHLYIKFNYQNHFSKVGRIFFCIGVVYRQKD